MVSFSDHYEIGTLKFSKMFYGWSNFLQIITCGCCTIKDYNNYAKLSLLTYSVTLLPGL